ncbi:MAG: endoglucanase, partial [Candidatus Omnitrophota bacterium]
SNFKKKLSENALCEFEDKFRDNFIKEKDLKNIKAQGFNVIRVPFNYRLIETAPYKYIKKGLGYLDRVIAWAKKYKIWVILDLHATPGAQNNDWHGDSLGKAELWTKPTNQKRTLAIWKLVSDRYKDEPWVAGYDLINESVLNNSKLLNVFYKEIIKTIRSVDTNHILFIEGNTWATDIKCLEEFNDDNYVLSIHNYEPLDLTFNFVPHVKYPCKTKKRIWNKTQLKKHLKQYGDISKARNVPIFVGEFGVHYREDLYGEVKWLDDILTLFNEYDFHWTYWTYKAIKHYMFPDGIYSYYENPPWVNRSGPVTGWNTYHLHWKKCKGDMVKSWDTKEFEVNTKVLTTLKKALK